MEIKEFDFETTFPPLGHPEHHFNKYPDHPWLKTKREIKKWLSDYDDVYFVNKKHYTINNDLTVTLGNKRPFSIIDDNKGFKIEYIPVQFREVDLFDCAMRNLKSAIGTPYQASSVYLFGNKNLESLEGLGNVTGILSLAMCGIKNFQNMPKFDSNLLTIDMYGNPIDSWEGFTNCNELVWWQNSKNESINKYLFMETPKKINQIKINDDLNIDAVLKFKNKDKKIIDMKDLREKQAIERSNKEIFDLNRLFSAVKSKRSFR